MDNANLWLAIKARAASDTGSGGLFAAGTPLVSGIYPNLFPQDENFPWITFDIEDVAPAHAFNKDVFTYTVRFNIYVPMESESITDPHQTASDIINRVYGDSTGGSAPSYGFHRHKLAPSGAWGGCQLLKIGSSIEHEDTDLHFVEQYQSAISQ